MQLLKVLTEKENVYRRHLFWDSKRTLSIQISEFSQPFDQQWQTDNHICWRCRCHVFGSSTQDRWEIINKVKCWNSWHATSRQQEQRRGVCCQSTALKRNLINLHRQHGKESTRMQSLMGSQDSWLARDEPETLCSLKQHLEMYNSSKCPSNRTPDTNNPEIDVSYVNESFSTWCGFLWISLCETVTQPLWH